MQDIYGMLNNSRIATAQEPPGTRPSKLTYKETTEAAMKRSSMIMK